MIEAGAPPSIHIDAATGQIGGVDAHELAARFGTPYYAYDLDAIGARVRALRAALPPRFDLAYAVKSNPALAVVHALGALGVDADIASGGELELVARAGISPDRVLFTGPGKSDAELTAALRAGVRAVTVESPSELRRLEALAAAGGVRQAVLLRLSVGDRSRHETVRIIGDDGIGKFGMSASDVEACARFAAASPHLDLRGVHAFGASNLRDADALVGHVGATVEFAARVLRDAGLRLRLVDAGGGLGIPYADGEAPLDLEVLGAGLRRLSAAWDADPALADLRVLLEPGRFLVGPTGVYVCRIIDRKELAGKPVAIVDGGIHHLLRPALVGQPHRVTLLATPDHRDARARDGGAPGVGGAEAPAGTMAIAGPLCTGLDILSRAAAVPGARVDDLVAILDAGAYGFTESMPLFLSRPWPVEIAIHDGRAALIRPRIEPHELLERQAIPAWD